MKSEQLKRDLAEKEYPLSNESGRGAFYNFNMLEERSKFINRLTVLIEAVIAERMPTKTEVVNEFPCNDGKTHVSKHNANRNFYRRQGANWFRSRMEGESK